jgi:hypothetical protein
VPRFSAGAARGAMSPVQLGPAASGSRRTGREPRTPLTVPRPRARTGPEQGRTPSRAAHARRARFDPAHLRRPLAESLGVAHDPATIEDHIAGVPLALVAVHGHQSRLGAPAQAPQHRRRVDLHQESPYSTRKSSSTTPESRASRSAPAVPRRCSPLVDVHHRHAPAGPVAHVASDVVTEVADAVDDRIDARAS